MTFHRDCSHRTLPKLGTRLLHWLLPDGERAEITGDFEERFQTKVQERGAAAGRIWFGFQLLRLIPYLVKDHVLWSCIMFRNNLIIAWRNIKKSKAHSALNVLGLAVGMAVFILIMLFVRYELSYDRYHANAKNIYRVVQEDPRGYFLGSNVYAVTPAPMAPALAKDFPEVMAATRIYATSNILVSVGDKNFFERVFWADPQTFEIFSFPLIRGNPATVLKDPFSVVLSEREARRLFGETNPMNQTISCRFRNNTFDFRVEGVFHDIPSNSHFVMDIVVPFETMAINVRRDFTRWQNNSYYTYVLLKEGTEARALDLKIPAFLDKNMANRSNIPIGQRLRYFLQPLTRIHLHSRANDEISPTGDARFVLLFASIAVLVLTIACVNYINLAAARSLKRIKEVGLRKVVGAARGQIFRQFLGDAMVLTYIALFLAGGIVCAVLPAFRTFVERDIVFNPFHDHALIPGLLLLSVAVGAVAGSYPAFFVSAFRPVSVLKNAGASRFTGRRLRNTLIVFQFAASITLIISTISVRSQLRYIQNRDMGYERDRIVVLFPRGSIRPDLDAFKTELILNPAVLKISTSSSLPNNVDESTRANWPGRLESDQFEIYCFEADYDFLDLYGLKLVQGRNFSRDYPSDAGGAFLINESARKALGWDNPIGRDFNRWGNKAAGKIVGVIKDFHMHSLHLPIMPLYIFLNPDNTFYVSVKIRGENIPQTLAFLQKTWERFEPEYPFQYSFFDEIFDQAYRAEQRLGKVFSAFAGLAVLIACLGLLGLASFTAEQKTKEIGIRKVLGASTSGIIALFSREFMKWIALANVIAWPIGYFAMRSWLRNFAYRTSLTVPMFLGAGLAAFIIAAAVISLQTCRAASANPADSIRYE